MLTALFDLARPILFALSPEDAHELTLKALEHGLFPRDEASDDPCLAVHAFGLSFCNPIAIAAGFDKDARVAGAVQKLGCGFSEVGTTTPLPQEGNPPPRIFRLIAERGVINRLGFNNLGHRAALANLQRQSLTRPLCVNIGANNDSDDRVRDYVKGIEVFYDVASLFMINISSPNTPGLRDLQSPEALDRLLPRLFAAREAEIATGKPRKPIIIKIAPDIPEADIGGLTQQLLAHAIDGIAVANTTLARTGLHDANAQQSGGLSGRPLFHRSTVMLARVFIASEGRIPLVGIGGIDSGETALAKIEAGASLLELYTSLIYEGPGLIRRIKSHLVHVCRASGADSLAELRGRSAEAWAARSLDGRT